MGLFKRTKALYYEKLNALKDVTVTPEKVKFSYNYSSIECKPEEVPRLLADFTLLYGLVKPVLDQQSEEANAENAKKAKDSDDEVELEPIDLSDIPF